MRELEDAVKDQAVSYSRGDSAGRRGVPQLALEGAVWLGVGAGAGLVAVLMSAVGLGLIGGVLCLLALLAGGYGVVCLGVLTPLYLVLELVWPSRDEGEVVRVEGEEDAERLGLEEAEGGAVVRRRIEGGGEAR